MLGAGAGVTRNPAPGPLPNAGNTDRTGRTGSSGHTRRPGRSELAYLPCQYEDREQGQDIPPVLLLFRLLVVLTVRVALENQVIPVGLAVARRGQ